MALPDAEEIVDTRRALLPGAERRTAVRAARASPGSEGDGGWQEEMSVWGKLVRAFQGDWCWALLCI